MTNEQYLSNALCVSKISSCLEKILIKNKTMTAIDYRKIAKMLETHSKQVMEISIGFEFTANAVEGIEIK